MPGEFRDTAACPVGGGEPAQTSLVLAIKVPSPSDFININSSFRLSLRRGHMRLTAIMTATRSRMLYS